MARKPNPARLETRVSRSRVQTVPVADPRRLLTVGEDFPIWTRPPAVPFNCPGSIVRLRPPEGASDEKVEEVRRYLLSVGEAAAVRVMPRPRSAVLPAAKVAAVARMSIRELAVRLAGEAVVEDRAALLAVVEEALDHAGL